MIVFLARVLGVCISAGTFIFIRRKIEKWEEKPLPKRKDPKKKQQTK